MTSQPIPSEFPNIQYGEHFLFFFYQCTFSSKQRTFVSVVYYTFFGKIETLNFSNIGSMKVQYYKNSTVFRSLGFLQCCYIRVDFTTAASQNGVGITQQMCHIMILFHDSSMIKDESHTISIVFAIF